MWLWSRPYLGMSGMNRSRYNEVRLFDEFSKGLVKGNFMKISPGSFFWYFHINGSLWIYKFGHDLIWGSRDWIGADIIKFYFLTNSQRGLVHGNFLKLSPGSFFGYFHINGSLWRYEFGHDHIWVSRDWSVANIMKFENLTNSQRGLVHGNFLEISAGRDFWYCSHKWVPMDI